MKTRSLLFGLTCAWAIPAVLLAETIAPASAAPTTAAAETPVSATTPVPAPEPAFKPTPAPAWQLQDVDGKVVRSEQFKGKVVIVDFWATWCNPCRKEIPGYIKLQTKYRKDGLVIIGIACDQGKNPTDAVRKFMKEMKMNYPVVLVEDDVLTAFGGTESISMLPTTFLIDRQGQIRDRKVGIASGTDYEQLVLKYLK